MDKRNTKFRIIARRVAGLLNVDEMYVYMWLLFKSGFDTGESHIKRGTLCECTGFKDKDTITGYTNKFRDLGLLKKHGNNFIEANVWKTANEYILAIPQIDWIRINYGLLEENIPRELKSFLVLLKCLCLNNTNICLYNYKQIGEKLNINRNTVSKYTKQCIELGKIKDLESGFLITDNNIIADPRKDGLSVNAKYTYRVISDYCMSKGLKPPKTNDKILNHIYMHFGITEEELIVMLNQTPAKNHKQIYKRFSLKYNLETKCKKLPERISSLNYFSKILLGENILTTKEAKPTYQLTY